MALQRIPVLCKGFVKDIKSCQGFGFAFGVEFRVGGLGADAGLSV